MSGLMQGISIGFFHTTIVLALAWMLCRCWTPFRQGQATGLVRGVTIAAFALVVAAFLPVPDYTVATLRGIAPQPPRALPDAISESPVEPAAWANGAGVGLNLSALQFIRDGAVLTESTNGVRTKSPVADWFLPALTAISVFLIARQLMGLWSLIWLCRNSVPIDDERCRTELEQLLRQTKSRAVQLKSTSLIGSAATTGWLHPVILLPTDHATWSRAELRAALAHELAHIQHGDFAWRMVAGLYAAVHFCNPLAHWLRNRVILEQELSADRVASSLVGGRRAYARALSQLAIRADGSQPNAYYPGLLSVTPTNLLRRIEMLRAKEGSSTPRKDRLYWSLGVATLVLTTIATTGLRVSAEKTAPGPVTESAGSSVTAFDPGQLVLAEQGVFLVRPSILVGEEMGIYSPLLRQTITTHLKELGMPELALDKIELVAGDIRGEVRHTGKTIEPGDEGHEHALILGSSGIIVRLHEPQDLVARIHELFPHAEVLDDSKQLFLLQAMPIMGPGRPRIRVLNDRTLALSFSAAGHKWIASCNEHTRKEHAWHAAWKAIDTGAVTVMIDKHGIEWPPTLKTWPQTVQNVLENTDFLGVGFSPQKSMALTIDTTLKADVSATTKSSIANDMQTALKETTKSGEGKFLAEWLDRMVVVLSEDRIRMLGPIAFPIKDVEHDVADRSETPDEDLPARPIRISSKLVEIDVKKLQNLGVDYLSVDEVATDETGTFSTSEIAHSLFLYMNKNPQASLALIDRMCGKGTHGELGKIVAAPVLTTLADRPASFRIDNESIRFVPKCRDGSPFISLDMEFNGSVEWKTTELTRPGKTHFLPVPSKANGSETRFVLVLQTEFADDVPATARRSDNPDRENR